MAITAADTVMLVLVRYHLYSESLHRDFYVLKIRTVRGKAVTLSILTLEGFQDFNHAVFRNYEFLRKC